MAPQECGISTASNATKKHVSGRTVWAIEKQRWKKVGGREEKMSKEGRRQNNRQKMRMEDGQLALIVTRHPVLSELYNKIHEPWVGFV